MTANQALVEKWIFREKMFKAFFILEEAKAV